MSKLIANRYEVIKTIGHGGMADVYLALDTILNREVAIKVLKADMSSDPISLERFNREANASTKISHPNIVDIYDVGEDDNQHYIVMEYVKGFTLKQLIQRRGAIPPREAVWMTKQLAGALMEAHKNGLIHRDIKSQNVLIKDDGTIKLADFGIAMLNNSMQLTSKDSVLGSVHYLAPELAKGGAASMQSDIYSLGIVFYELLTGDVPFKADTPVQIALMHIKNQIPDVRKFNPQISQSIVNVLAKATAKETKDRYENIALMIKDLNICLDEIKGNVKPLEQKVNTKKVNKTSDYNISADAKKDGKFINGVHKGFSTLLIVSISLISVIAIVIMLLLSGAFSGNNSKNIKVPEIEGLRFASALDALDAAGIEVDYPVEHVLTDDILEGIVVEVVPNPGSDLAKGTKVKLTVSDGLYSIMPDYVGKNIEDVQAIFAATNITVKINAIEDDNKQSGTIVSQSGILAGDKYDPSLTNKIVFKVSYPSTMNIPAELLGSKLDSAIELLEDQGFNVESKLIDKDELSDSDLNRYKAGTVCKVEPEEGSLYVKSDDSVVTLYYYDD
ncbi:MAG: Stk1 family PASTA domain-containing Ser/Thr kinase [Erysipelotrichaceae bacterium]|nr:Stk1 family PASTA domain-containing Ser/Thr kinase [Erysipelotrichaceae bacterium]